MKGLDVFICFKDGSKIILPNVEEYIWDANSGAVKVMINRHYQFFNLDSVLFIGIVSDLGEEIVSA